MLERKIKDNMKRDNGDLYLFKLVGIGLALFYLFIYLGTSFVTVGLDRTISLFKARDTVERC